MRYRTARHIQPPVIVSGISTTASLMYPAQEEEVARLNGRHVRTERRRRIR
jgi:hypothetical protein